MLCPCCMRSCAQVAFGKWPTYAWNLFLQEIFLQLCLRMPIRRSGGFVWRVFKNFVRESNARKKPPMRCVICIHKCERHHIILIHIIWPTLFFEHYECGERGQRQRRAWMQSAALALLGDDVLLKLDAPGLIIILKDGEVDRTDKEAINVLRWLRRHHLPIRALKGCIRTTCTSDHVMAMRKTITLYLSKGGISKVAAKGGTQTGGLVDMSDIVTTMVACTHAENGIWKYEGNIYLAVVICSDPPVFQNASATRYDVFVDLWGDRGAHHDDQAWASWWAFDGGDDVVHLQRMDAPGKLNYQVKKGKAEGGIEIGGTPKNVIVF